jgi:signal transduction histidine kinase
MKEVSVVILDDEVDILNLCTRLFKSHPFGVLATTDHQEALRVIETHDIKVVLSDNRMPGIAGVDFLRMVKEKKPATIRILFTGQADVQVVEDAINRGEVFRFLNKPFDLKELSLLVVEAIDKFDLVRNNQQLTENISKRNEELEALSVKLQQRYDAQRQFTSTVSHELRTPLASIKSSIDILNTEAPGKLSDDQKMFIKRVKANIDRLARLINDVLDLSKLEAGKMVMNLVPIRPLVQVKDILEMNAPVVAEKGLKLEMEVADDLPEIMADKDRLTQVFSNLINNALKFTQEGKITLVASCEDKVNMMFCVRDTGVGIKEDDLSKLFQKFQQVGASAQQVAGTGLGLAICREIIAAHGGRIWVESEVGKGSSFFFTIPVKIVKRVLIVDDDPGTLVMLKSVLLGTDKYEVDMASDGFMAGQKSQSFKPHLIILDNGMPEIDGLLVCAKIKNDPETKGIKIIMHSSFANEEDEKKALAAGADDILKKPAGAADIISKVEKLILW